MAERRMFAKSIIDSDAFLEMPLSTQALYFHLSMRADDDGFINNPKKIMRMLGCAEDDVRILVSRNFIIPFESGVVVIKHWRIHNLIRADRHKATNYVEEMSQLTEKENGAYTLDNQLTTNCQPTDNQMSAQVRIGKESIDKDNNKRFVPPSKSEVKEYCEERQNGVDVEKWFAHYESNGFMVGRNKMKDWKAAVRTWEKGRKEYAEF